MSIGGLGSRNRNNKKYRILLFVLTFELVPCSLKLFYLTSEGKSCVVTDQQEEKDSEHGDWNKRKHKSMYICICILYHYTNNYTYFLNDVACFYQQLILLKYMVYFDWWIIGFSKRNEMILIMEDWKDFSFLLHISNIEISDFLIFRIAYLFMAFIKKCMCQFESWYT